MSSTAEHGWEGMWSRGLKPGEFFDGEFLSGVSPQILVLALSTMLTNDVPFLQSVTM